MADLMEHHGPDQLYPSNTFITWEVDKAVKLRADDENIVTNPPVSVVTVFTEVAQCYPDRIALVDSYNDIEDVYTYKRYYDSVVHVAKAFIKLGLESSHGVGIIGFNAPQWFIAYLGTIFAGGVTVGFSRYDFGKYILQSAGDAKCNIMVVENEDYVQQALKIADDLPHLKAIIQYRGQRKEHSNMVYSWDELMNLDVDDCEEEFKRRMLNISPNKCCSLFLTSGTTGKPKLIMYSHDNILWALKNFVSFVNENETYPPDTFVSFHDLCNLTSVVVDVFWPLICKGGTLYFAKSDALEGSLVETLRKVRPTVFVAYPFIYEMIMNSFHKYDVDNCTAEQETLSCVDVKANNSHPEKIKVDENGELKKDDVQLLKGMASRIGLDRCRIATVGGKTCRQEVYEFFLELGIPLIQLYAMTETGCITTNLKSNFKIDSVGHMIPNIQLKFQPVDDEGDKNEIYVSGRNVFMGYLNNERLTKEAFDETCVWFHTSDLGKLDEDGMLTLFGRVNDFIVLNGNFKIFPGPIEKLVLQQLPCLSHCVVVGENEDRINALLVFKTKVDPETGEPTDFLDQSALDWCRNLGVYVEKLSELVSLNDTRIQTEIQRVVDKINKGTYVTWDEIHKWKILPRDFSVKGGELGNMKKLKRKAIIQLYKDEIRELYK